ncbi:molybdopterin-synthase adenylyltransferase MoeB [Actinomyces oricola]|uniref:molybdopterin-synthase adenylyltransferase MoeB n=1 Tax=Actinomyces oricola TaxID=206043 RepID=UPI001F5040F6
MLKPVNLRAPAGRGASTIRGSQSVVAPERLVPLTEAERVRYSRNMLVPGIGVRGQQRIRAARVLVVGAGGLGSAALLYLAAAGVGTLGVIDNDAVDVSNLQRQVIHTTGRVGTAKVDSAHQAIRALNPDVNVVTHRRRLTAANALQVLAGYDVVLDGSDNFPTRYLVNDACVMTGVPLVHGAVLRFDGQVGVFDARQGPCYRCLHPEPPPAGSVVSCAHGGVLGVLPGLVGTMQAAEALKLIVGGAEPLVGRLLLIDAWGARVRELPVQRNPECAVCGSAPTMTDLEDNGRACGAGPRPTNEEEACGAGPRPTNEEDQMREISAVQLRERLAAGERPGEEFTLLDVRQADEIAERPMPGALHIPLGEVVERMGELDATRETVVVCAAGVRSAKAIEALTAAGYTGALINLAGGVRAWLETT